jgi:hypothetical protein
MKFQTFKGNLRSRRITANLHDPAVVEELEVRSLLTASMSVHLTGPVDGPPAVVNSATPTLTWNPDINAVSYDLWITDAEQRTRELYKSGITEATFTPTDDLNLGLTLVWVRSNYASGPASEWSPPTTFIVQVKPTVTGPGTSLSGSPAKLTQTKPEIEWTSPPGAVRFEIYLENLTTLTVERISLGVIPELDNNPVLAAETTYPIDVYGQIQRPAGNSYSYELTDDLLMGSYQVFVRSIDDRGKFSDWSAANRFQVAPRAEIIRPAAPTFQTSQAVEISLSGTPTSGSYTIVLTTAGAGGRTFRTTLPYNAKTAQVEQAIRQFSGFETAKVSTSGASPNVTHLVSLPASLGNVTASVANTFNAGAATIRKVAARTVLLEWKPVAGATQYHVRVDKVNSPGSTTRVYSAFNLTTTSWQIPNLLAEGDYVFRVQAIRRHQVTEIKLTGTPTSGSYRIVLTTSGKEGKTQQTAPLSYNATAAQIKAAVVSLEGFKNADVVSVGTAPNVRHLLQIPQTSGAVTVNVIGSVSPGTLTHVTHPRPEVEGLLSSSTFSTISQDDPTVTAPVGVATNSSGRPVVTEIRPTIEWTRIDNAARYEIWIDASYGKTPYLTARSSTNSYKLEQDIKPGNYTVWVRAASTTGVLTAWSKAYMFEATGGAPVITSPVANASVSPIPNITWTVVPDAASYEIWFSWVGVDADYIVADAITSTNYSPTTPLPTGTYRVWVRAIKADGSALRWSVPLSFSVAANEIEQQGDGVPELLASLFSTKTDPQADIAAETRTMRSFEQETQDAPNDGQRVRAESSASFPVQASPAMTAETEDLIQHLAERCKTAEWWMPQGSDS